MVIYLIGFVYKKGRHSKRQLLIFSTKEYEK